MGDADTALVWFRRDLRLTDNPALDRARRRHRHVLPVYIHAPEEEGPGAARGAGAWWLHRSLEALSEDLGRIGAPLCLARGPALDTLLALARDSGAGAVYWNRLYEPSLVARDREVKEVLTRRGLEVRTSNGALMQEPWSVQTRQGGPFRVFTPFWKAHQALEPSGEPLPAPQALSPPAQAPASLSLDALGLLSAPPWWRSLEAFWQPGEAGARRTLAAFADDALGDYAEARDRPDRPLTSRLSPHLRFGEISPGQALAAARSLPPDQDAAPWVRQLGWRDFAHHVLFHFPHTVDAPLDPRFARFPWAWAEEAPADLQAWQQGRTGIPLVDAGMRELWQSGWMHNRVRMVAASLLTKNLGLHWREGERWFRDTLVDADLANNLMGWQWTAGCGADAAPFFRIFNPVTQGRRFDPEGSYVRRWLPELAHLPARYIHAPWEAPEQVLGEAGVSLGRDYPHPLVDLKASRRAALEAYGRITGKTQSS